MFALYYSEKMLCGKLIWRSFFLKIQQNFPPSCIYDYVKQILLDLVELQWRL